MRFAENNRISHRQLYRQIVLTFSAPFLLSMFGEGKIKGISGVTAILVSVVMLSFYVLFLIRQESVYTDLKKYAGRIGAGIVGIFFLIFIILTAAYLLRMMGDIVPTTLVTGVSGNWIVFFAVLACGFGTHKGMQRRGRVADVMGGVFLFIIAVILLLCIGQGNLSYVEEMNSLAGWNLQEFLRSGYGVLCAFSGIGLFPFLLEYVEKPGSAWKPVMAGIATVAGILISMLFLLAAILGWNRMNGEKYPVLPLLAGANLPGNVLARFDVLWMAFLLFGLLFAVGSMMHYGHLIMRKNIPGSGKYWIAAVMYFLAVFRWEGIGIEDYYGKYLAYFYVPGLLFLQIVLMFLGKEKKKRKVSAAAACFLLVMFLTGCGGVEPEKRIYPLAMGIDFSDEKFAVTYGMADLPEATGQSKPEEGGQANTITLQGEDFSEIEEIYNRSQEKYLDLGHLEVLILGEELLGYEQDGYEWEENEQDGNEQDGYEQDENESGRNVFDEMMGYLKNQPFIGENIYIFQTENPEKLVGWKTEKGTSLGEYITGIMENRTDGQQNKGVTLRDVYYRYAKDGKVPKLPTVVMGESELEIFW